jgi:hypothetical protein
MKYLYPAVLAVILCFNGCSSYCVYRVGIDPSGTPVPRAMVYRDSRLIVAEVDGQPVPDVHAISVLPGPHQVFVHYYEAGNRYARASSCGFQVNLTVESGKSYVIEPASVGTGWKPVVVRMLNSAPVETLINEHCMTFDELQRYHSQSTSTGCVPDVRKR